MLFFLKGLNFLHLLTLFPVFFYTLQKLSHYKKRFFIFLGITLAILAILYFTLGASGVKEEEILVEVKREVSISLLKTQEKFLPKTLLIGFRFGSEKLQF